MCGLAGILRTDGRPIPDSWLDLLDEAIAARGPDGHGRFRDRSERGVEIALVHRRLAILDPAGGAQPMTLPADPERPGGSITTVFNGCVYNHRQLRRSLEGFGHRFRSDHADTETLLHGWREHGPDLPAQLEGMYAFAIWESGAGTLFLARDPFGEKPLWIVRPEPGLVAFSSMAAPLLRLWPNAARRADPGTVAEFLRRGCGWTSPAEAGGTATDPPAADRRELAPLAPGSWLRIDADGSSSGRHHDGRDRAHADDEERTATSIDAVDRAVDDAVAARLESDVPLGCFLSGGVDSSLVAAAAIRHLGQLRTFCVRMPDPRLDESTRAATIAAHLGTQHTTLDVDATDGDDAAADLLMLMESIGVPFGDSSILPTHWVSRAARREVTVALSGDGGDELFLGYRRHVLADRIAAFRSILRWLPASSIGTTAGRVGDIARDLPHTGVAAFAAPFPERLVHELVPDAPAPVRRPMRDGAHGPLRALREFDLAHYLPDDLLLKVDTASMAVALEVRSPLLDRRVAALALDSSVATLLNAPPCRGRKALLRAVLRRHLPADLVDGPKRGFAIPIGRWWREDFGGLGTLLQDALGRSTPFGSLPIDETAARRMLAAHLEGRADHGQRLFALLSLAIWSSRTATD